MRHLAYCLHWSACGHLLAILDATTETVQVTCGNCRRTTYFADEQQIQAAALRGDKP